MSHEWKLLRAGATLALALRGITLALSLGASIVLARMLPQDVLGAYFLTLNAAAVATMLMLFGANAAMQRFVGAFVVDQNFDAVRVLWRDVIRLVAMWSALVGAVLVLGWSPLVRLLKAPAMGGLGGAALALAWLGVIEELASVYFRSVRRLRAGILLMSLPRQVLFLGALGLLAWLSPHAGLTDVVLLRTAALLAAVLLAGRMVVHDLRRRPRGGDRSKSPSTRMLARIAAPMALHAAAAWVLAGSDLWFLGFVRSGAEVGIYGAMTRVATLVGTLIAVVNAVLPPLLAGMYEHRRLSEMENLMRRASTVTGWAAVALCGALMIAGRGLVVLAFGAAFEPGVVPLLLLACGYAFNVAAGSPGWLLQMTGHQDVLVRITTGAVVLNLVLNGVAVYVAGMTGVAAATLVTLVVQNVLMAVAARRLVGIRTWAYLNPWNAARVAQA